MNLNFKSTFVILILINSILLQAQYNSGIKSINSGMPWYDQNGNSVSAHGANIIKDNGQYYMFGEFKSDAGNAFTGFSCYSSNDLYNWKFENIVLSTQVSGKLGPNRVGERPKVLKCPSTGEYILFMHVDSLTYNDQFVGYATSDKINGIYKFQGPLLYNRKPIKKWDMGVFQDTDGSGYVITHSGNLYKLSDDYKSVTEQLVKNMTPKCEAPAIFKNDSIYFWLGSDLTSWERNDNYYFTATSLRGPWISHGIIAPIDKLTWNSQSTYVLTVAGTQDTTFMFMGDRWAYPKQNSAATYVWQPLFVNGESISLPLYYENWQIDNLTGKWNIYSTHGNVIECSDKKNINYKGKWFVNNEFSVFESNQKNASCSIHFNGSQIGFSGLSQPKGGYAKIIIRNKKGKILLSSIIDMYCKYPEVSQKFLSPVLPKGKYSLTLTVMGEHGNWSKKDGTIFGSTDDFVSVNKFIIED